MTFEEMEKLEYNMNRFLRQYPLLPQHMIQPSSTWYMPGLLGLDKYEFENRYGKGATLSIRQGIIVQINHVRRKKKLYIDAILACDSYASGHLIGTDSMWSHTASAMGRLFLLNRPELADKVYRYMEELCKKT